MNAENNKKEKTCILIFTCNYIVYIICNLILKNTLEQFFTLHDLTFRKPLEIKGHYSPNMLRLMY